MVVGVGVGVLGAGLDGVYAFVTVGGVGVLVAVGAFAVVFG